MFFPPDKAQRDDTDSCGEVLERRLPSGMVLKCVDRSNRYFGDYHRIYLELSLEIALSPELLHACLKAEPELVIDRSRTYVFRKHLERMGVPGALVEQTRKQMLDSFVETSGGYLSDPVFPVRFILNAQSVGS